MRKAWICSVLVALLGASTLRAQDDVETRAMRDELQRSMKELHLESSAGPYYIAYKIVDTRRKAAQASFGALISSSESRNRSLIVSVRVGSYAFDNSNAPAGSNPMAVLSLLIGTNVALPLDDSYDELRRKIWIATDAAYKSAVEQLAAKKAARQNQEHREETPDYTQEPARQESEVRPFIELKLADAERLARIASQQFRSLSSVETSTASVAATDITERFLNSEGTSYLRQGSQFSFHVDASVQRSDGESFGDSYNAYARTAAEMPAEAKLMEETKSLSDRLAERLHGKTVRRYNGPVLVEGQAAADLFAHHFGSLLASHPHSGNVNTSAIPAINALFNGSTASLISKLGSRVLPDFMTVVNDPFLASIDGHPLLGDYKFDEEGTPAQQIVLVKNGVLKTLLTSRTPAHDLPNSTGSMRGHGVLPGNLIVGADKTSDPAELKAKLLEIVKARDLEFGIVVRRLSGTTATEASRIYPDGHEELLRDARLNGISSSSFKDILAVSKERAIWNEQVQATSLLTLSPVPADLVSYVVPSLLFEDMTVERTSTSSPKPPAVESPFASR